MFLKYTSVIEHHPTVFLKFTSVIEYPPIVFLKYTSATRHTPIVSDTNCKCSNVGYFSIWIKN